MLIHVATEMNLRKVILSEKKKKKNNLEQLYAIWIQLYDSLKKLRLKQLEQKVKIKGRLLVAKG